MRHAIFDGVASAPADVVEALGALQTVTARLRAAGDARAVFPDVYAVITRRVKEAVVDGRGPTFLEPRWIARLAGIFCEYYVAALEASVDGRQTGSEAWDAAFRCGSVAGVAASLNALMGINAHINYDLAQGLYENIVRHGAANDAAMLRRYRHDHDLVNEILAAAMPEILQVLAERYGCPLASALLSARVVREAGCAIVLRALRWWRDRVWDDLLAMLAAADQDQKRAVLARMNRRSAMVARAVVVVDRALRPGYDLLRRLVGKAPERAVGRAPESVVGRVPERAVEAPGSAAASVMTLAA